MFEITSRYPILISLLLLTVSLFFAYYFYRKTNLPGIKKYILIGIKAVAIFLLLLLFIEPSISALTKINRKPVNCLLIDNSRSNNLTFNDKTKSSQVIEIYKRLNIFKQNRDEFHIYTFSHTASPVNNYGDADSLSFDGFETNLLSALGNIEEKFPEEVYNSVTIISDGIFNAGANPLYTAKTFQCPFITIGIGDSVQQKDIVVNNVLCNDKAFTETVNKIGVEVSAYGFAGEKVNINLIREGSVVALKTVDINSKDWRGEATFDIRESGPGIIKYRVDAENKPGEITYKNNHSDFLIKYIQNKVNILYISDGPGYDNAIISSIIKRIKNYNVTIKTAKSNNDFYEGPIDFNSFYELSAVFLHGFPSRQFSADIVSALAEKLKSYNIPIIFFAGKNTDYKKLEIFDELIPFTIERPGTGEATVALQSTGNAGTNSEDVLRQITTTPQLFRNQGMVLQKTGSEVMLIDRSSGEPILIIRNTPKNKSAAFLGYGFWRWRLNQKNNYEPALEKFLVEIIDMSLMKDKKSKLTVLPDKDIFDYTEDVRFTAEVYDENFIPIKNASIKTKVISGHNIINDNLEFTFSDNKYHLNAGRLQPGDYKIEAEANVNNIFYAKDESRFVLDTLNLEYKATRSNYENLKLISDNTSGRFFTGYLDIDSINSYTNSILENKDKTQISRYVRVNLWENKYTLLTVIFLFAAEWLIRKRNNIP